MHRLILISATLFLATGPLAAQEPRVSMKKGADHVDLLLDGKLATRYRYEPTLPRPIFFPVLAPGGVPVTRSWPVDKSVAGDSTDHPHQQSFWFCHGDVIPVGKTLTDKIKGVDGADFWSVAKGHGVIRQESMRGPVAVDDGLRFQTNMHWTASKVDLLTEQRRMTFRPAPQGWLMVFEIDLTAPECAVIFGDTKEGSFALRVNDQMRADKMGNGQIRQPGGKKSEKECWGQRAPWCDYAGAVDGKKVGVTVFAGPKNPAPTAWHVRGYGLFAANPFGRKSFKVDGDLIRLEKGETLKLQYAVHVYAGERTEAEIEKTAKELWN